MFTTMHQVIEKDPTKSLVYNQRAEDEKHFLVKADPNDDHKMTGRQKTVIWLFGITFCCVSPRINSMVKP